MTFFLKPKESVVLENNENNTKVRFAIARVNYSSAHKNEVSILKSKNFIEYKYAILSLLTHIFYVTSSFPIRLKT